MYLRYMIKHVLYLRFIVHGLNRSCIFLVHNMTLDLHCGACKITDTISSQKIKVVVCTFNFRPLG